MQEIKRLRFIPFCRANLVQMCLEQASLSDSDQSLFQRVCADIEQHLQREFYAIKQRLKEAYGPNDPDADTRVVEEFRDENAASRLAGRLEQVLDRANYEKVTRGAQPREEELPMFFGLWRKTIQFINYDRVVIYIRFRENIDADSTLGGCQPGSTMLKLSQLQLARESGAVWEAVAS